MEELKKFGEFVNENNLEELNERRKSGSPVQNIVIDWLDKKENEYSKMVKKLFIGKSIIGTAMKWNEDGHNWNMHSINNIKDVQHSGGPFYSEFGVKDGDGEWYTLLGDEWGDYKFVK